MDKKDKIQMYIIYSIITIAFNILFSVFGNTIGKVGSAASVEYVNTENVKQDNINKDNIKEIKVSLSEKANKSEFDSFTVSFSKTLEIMDKRIYDIWINRDGK